MQLRASGENVRFTLRAKGLVRSGVCGKNVVRRVIRRDGTNCRLYSHDRYVRCVNGRMYSETQHEADTIEETERNPTGRFSTMHLIGYPLL